MIALIEIEAKQMVRVTEQQSELNLTVALDENLSDSFASGLERSGYHLMLLDGSADVNHLLSTHNIDAILLAASAESRSLAENLPLEQRERLLLLVVPLDMDTPVEPNIVRLVDAVLPAHPVYLEKQLKTLLQLHQKNYAMRRRLAELEADVAAQKRLTSEIEVLKNAIVRNVSHELRTPLLQVKSAVSLIAEEVANKQLITYAENATARLETHVKNITMLGHSLDINIGAIILRDTVEYAKRNLSRIWTRRGDVERVQLEIQANLPPVLADMQGLSTVLQLLMDNAIKFSTAPIQVIARKEGDKIFIGVQDAGIGIEQSKLQDIFESFYQVDSSSTRPYGGAGVGLALVKLILDHHNIIIHVDSTVGKGSIFWFYLPYVDISHEIHHDED
jgi:signal transduction histidine kinase